MIHCIHCKQYTTTQCNTIQAYWSLPGIHNLDWNDPVSLLQVCRAIVPLVKQHNKCNDSFNTSTVSVPWLLIPLFFQTGEKPTSGTLLLYCPTETKQQPSLCYSFVCFQTHTRLKRALVFNRAPNVHKFSFQGNPLFSNNRQTNKWW